jgi:hypothetical protein
VLLLVLLATEHLVEEAELGDAGDSEEAEDQHEEVEESHSEYLVEFSALVPCWCAECRCRGGMESCVRSRAVRCSLMEWPFGRQEDAKRSNLPRAPGRFAEKKFKCLHKLNYSFTIHTRYLYITHARRKVVRSKFVLASY